MGKTGMALGCGLVVDDRCCYVDWLCLSVTCAESTCKSVAQRQKVAKLVRIELMQDGRRQFRRGRGCRDVDCTRQRQRQGRRVVDMQDTCRLGSKQRSFDILLGAWQRHELDLGVQRISAEPEGRRLPSRWTDCGGYSAP